MKFIKKLKVWQWFLLAWFFLTFLFFIPHISENIVVAFLVSLPFAAIVAFIISMLKKQPLIKRSFTLSAIVLSIVVCIISGIIIHWILKHFILFPVSFPILIILALGAPLACLSGYFYYLHLKGSTILTKAKKFVTSTKGFIFFIFILSSIILPFLFRFYLYADIESFIVLPFLSFLGAIGITKRWKGWKAFLIAVCGIAIIVLITPFIAPWIVTAYVVPYVPHSSGIGSIGGRNCICLGIEGADIDLLFPPYRFMPPSLSVKGCIGIILRCKTTDWGKLTIMCYDWINLDNCKGSVPLPLEKFWEKSSREEIDPYLDKEKIARACSCPEYS